MAPSPIPAARSFGIISPSAPKNRAVLIRAPRFPSSVIWSAARRSSFPFRPKGNFRQEGKVGIGKRLGQCGESLVSKVRKECFHLRSFQENNREMGPFGKHGNLFRPSRSFSFRNQDLLNPWSTPQQGLLYPMKTRNNAGELILSRFFPFFPTGLPSERLGASLGAVLGAIPGA